MFVRNALFILLTIPAAMAFDCSDCPGYECVSLSSGQCFNGPTCNVAGMESCTGAGGPVDEYPFDCDSCTGGELCVNPANGVCYDDDTCLSAGMEYCEEPPSVEDPPTYPYDCSSCLASDVCVNPANGLCYDDDTCLSAGLAQCPCERNNKWRDDRCWEQGKPICVKGNNRRPPALGDEGVKCARCVNDKNGGQKDSGCWNAKPRCKKANGSNPPSGKAGVKCV